MMVGKGMSAADTRRMLALVSDVSRSDAVVSQRMECVMRTICEMTRAQVSVVVRVRRKVRMPLQLDAMIDYGFAAARARVAYHASSTLAGYRDEPLEEAFDRMLAEESVPAFQEGPDDFPTCGAGGVGGDGGTSGTSGTSGAGGAGGAGEAGGAGGVGGRGNDGKKIISAKQRSLRTVRRQDVMPDEAWYASGDVADVRRPAGLDDCIYSIYPLREVGHYACLALHKRWGDRNRFTPRDRAVVDFVWQALDFLHDAPLHSTLEKLGGGPRLDESLLPVLEWLKSGDSSRNAALKLGLPAAEFRRRVNQVFHAYEVRNRIELLAALLRQAE